MAWTKKQIILALVMVATGSINTLSTKWADLLPSKNRQGTVTEFNHPFFQAAGMFLGEMSCMVVHLVVSYVKRPSRNGYSELSPETSRDKFPPWIFYVPALCDMTATSLMYVGLTLTFASSFQMLRGAVIVFTGLLSVAFLGRRLKYFHWLGIFIVIFGLLLVGLADFISISKQDTDINAVITGDLLIVIAQVVTATQMVVEEKLLTGYNVSPLLAVGWEGVFGFVTLSLLLVPMYYIPVGRLSGNERGVMEDAIDAFVQLGNNGTLLFAFLLNVSSIAFFNFAGVSVTKELSATTRVVLDSVRTLVIWVFSLGFAWQKFQFLQLAGYCVLVVGMMLYNDVVLLPFLRRLGVLEHDAPPAPAPSPSSQKVAAGPDQDVVDHGTVEVY